MGLLQNGTRTTATNDKAWLLSPHHLSDEKSVMIASGNGTTNFGAIKAGTPLGIITASSKYRPAGASTVNGASSTTSCTVDESANFYVGDTVKFISAAGRLGTRLLDSIAGAGEGINLTGTHLDGYAHVVVLVDPGALRATTDVTSISVTAGVATITVTLSSTGAPAINATLTDVINAINVSGATQYLRASLPAGDTGSSVITAGVSTNNSLQTARAVGTVIDNTETLSAVNKTTHLLTFANSVDVDDGDYVQLNDGADAARGILKWSVNTFSNVNIATGAATHADQPGIMTLTGRMDASELTGYNATLMGPTTSVLSVVLSGFISD